MKIEWTAGSYAEELLCPDRTAFVGIRIFDVDSVSCLNINAFDEPDEDVEGVTCRIVERTLYDGRRVRFYCYVYEDPIYARILRHFLGMKHIELAMDDFSLTVTV